jgi:Rrf2 family protein
MQQLLLHMAANSRTAVATHIMTSLALTDEPVSSTYLGKSVNTNPVVIRRILSDLQNAGLVQTIAGKKGGARLARPATQITLQDIYCAVDNGNVLAYNQNAPLKTCPVSSTMKAVLQPVFESADSALAAELQRTRLSDLVKTIRSKAKL